MGTITSTTGLISGIDTKALIDQLIAIESRPKTLIQNRSTVLKTTQAAYQEINATLLGLKNSANGFSPTLFSATASTSSDDSIMGVKSSASAAPGSYSFTVNRLVSGQQTVSKGMLDTNFTQIAPQGATLSFDRGESRLDSLTQLATLNGGTGIKRGYIRVTDRSGNSTVVDLRSVVTVNDVIDKLNQATGVNIFAEIDGDAIKVSDLSGGVGNFTIADVGGNGTATSLGLAASVAAAQITGTSVNTIGRDTLLATLNDGNGVRNRAGVDDLRITTSGGGTYNIDIENVKTVGELIDLVNTTSGGNVTAAVNADGTGIALTDASGGGGGAGFAVTAINSSSAAIDLGLIGDDADGDEEIIGNRLIASINSKLLKNLNGGEGVAGLAGSSQVTLLGSTSIASLFSGTGLAGDGTGANDIKITTRIGAAVEIDIDSVAGGTVNDLINLINGASANLSATIDGQGLRITDISGGASNLIIENINGSTVATTLGITLDADQNQVTTGSLSPTGVAASAAVIRITNRTGAATNVDLDGAQSVEDVIAAINAAGAGVTAAINNAGTGILLTDTTAGTGSVTVSDVSGTAAASLRLAKSSATGSSTLDSGNLQYRYIFESTRLDTLGVTRGKFTLTDSSGVQATVDLTQGNEITINDVISEINSRGLAITARINDTGDGILLEDTGLGTFAITVAEDGSTTAADLGLLGEAAAPGRNLDGSFERTVSLSGDDTLETAITKINDAKVGVLAAVINDGSPGAPYRLSLQARTEGTRGAFTFDDGGLDLGVTNVNTAQDAVVFFGSTDPAKALQITAKSNTIENIVPGVTVTLKRASDIPVTVTVNRDDAGVTAAAKAFVDNFNKVVAAIDKHDSYDAETEERGLLLGDSTVTTTKNRLYALITNRNTELTSQFSSLSQIGIRVGKDSVLEFDEAKFTAALATDRDAVEALFTLKETAEDEVSGDLEITRGGIGVRIDEYLARLTDSVDGVYKGRVDTLSGQIEVNDRRIADIDKVLESKRARLERQFLAMEEALAQMQGQGNSLTQLQNLAS